MCVCVSCNALEHIVLVCDALGTVENIDVKTLMCYGRRAKQILTTHWSR